MKSIRVQMTGDMHKDLKTYAAQNDTTIQKIVIKLVSDFLKNDGRDDDEKRDSD